MKGTVRIDVDQAVRDEAARHLAEQGLTIGQTMRIVLEHAAAGRGPDFGALVPNATTVKAITAARRRDLVELGSPAFVDAIQPTLPLSGGVPQFRS